VVEREETALKFLVPHEQLAKPVEPAMAHLNHPSSRLLLGIAPFDVRLPASIDHVPNVAMVQNDLHCWFASIACVGTQVLVAPLWRCLALDHDGLQYRINLGDVVLIGPGHDDRQRDTTPVHQQMSLAPLFSPDRSDFGRPLLVPRVP
jgi:hypothetical protein